MLDRIKNISKMMEDTKKNLEKREEEKKETLKSPFEREMEKMQEEIDYILKASDKIEIEQGYPWELKELERELVTTQVKDIKLFGTGILIETSGEGQRYIESSTTNLEELEGIDYRILEEIKEEGEESLYIVAKESRIEKVERYLFLEVVPYDPGKSRRNIFIDISKNWSSIEVLEKSKIYKIKADINPEKADFSKVNTSRRSLRIKELKKIGREELIGSSEELLESLEIGNNLSLLKEFS